MAYIGQKAYYALPRDTDWLEIFDPWGVDFERASPLHRRQSSCRSLASLD